MHLREEGLKENYLIPTSTVASMVGKVVIAEKDNMEDILSIQYQLTMLTDSVAWGGEYEVAVFSGGRTTLIMVDPELPDYYYKQLENIIVSCIEVDKIEINTSGYDLDTILTTDNTGTAITWQGTQGTSACLYPYTTTTLSPS